jgi:hypothetical protein
LLEGTVVAKTDVGELADAELVVDVGASVDFFAGVAVGLEANAGLEELDLGGDFGWGGGLFGLRSGGSLSTGGLLGVER